MIRRTRTERTRIYSSLNLKELEEFKVLRKKLEGFGEPGKELL